MSSFDDIFAPQTGRQRWEGQPFDKDAWAAKKQEERKELYALADATAVKISSSGEKFQAYLDVQARFSRYTPTNALLILAQMPEATQLRDYDSWKDLGVSVQRKPRGVKILEPGREYDREDGTRGTSFEVKRVYDVSQTRGRLRTSPAVQPDSRTLLKALIHRSPVPIQTVESIPNNMGALYDHQQQVIFVCRGMGAEDIFRSVSKELCHAELAEMRESCPAVDGVTYRSGVYKIPMVRMMMNLLDSWDESDGMFAVTYSTTNANESVMTIKMTAQGLKEINTNKRVYTGASMVNSGYSDCTIRITYKATMHSDESVVYGDSGNPNEVVLLWKRSSQDYYDTLVDDAHVYTYAMELTKLFSDGNGNFENVEFIMQNDSDGYFVKAELNEEEGIYYVVDHVENEADATHFVPVIPQAVNPRQLVEYKVIVKGLEDDNYTVTEVRTDDGYTLLKDDIKIVISQVETTELCDIYASDVLGLVQNDPRYATIINDTGDLKNMPQKHLEHHLLTASATVDGNDVNMLEDDGSINAVVPLKVVNTRGFDLPQTGDHGTWMFSVIGIMLMAGAAVVIIMTSRKKRTADQ